MNYLKIHKGLREIRNNINTILPVRSLTQGEVLDLFQDHVDNREKAGI